jgi:hypothetical protein
MLDNMNKDSCEMPFWKDPGVIFRDFTLLYDPECKYQTWNFIVRLSIISLIVGLIGTLFAGLNAFTVSIFFALLTGFIIMITSYKYIKREGRWGKYNELPMIEKVKPKLPQPKVDVIGGTGYIPIKPVISEGFSSSMTTDIVTGIQEVDAAPYSGPALPDFTPPTSRNPFMNVLLDEYKYNPHRPSAASVADPSVKQTFDDYFRVQWFSDPTDVFGKNQSQRQFITQPSTSIPNDRESYQNWLYKIPGKTCKQGGRESCLPGTDGSPVTWLNQDS